MFEKHDVEYMIVGGYAVAFHGSPRFTKDLDIWFDASSANVERVKRALLEFGFEERDLETEKFTEPGNIVTFGVPPVRVDLFNSIDGVTFEQARPGMAKGKYGKVAARFTGRAELIKNKRSTSRTRAKAGAEELEKPRRPLAPRFRASRKCPPIGSGQTHPHNRSFQGSRRQSPQTAPVTGGRASKGL